MDKESRGSYFPGYLSIIGIAAWILTAFAVGRRRWVRRP